jgi:hypothetical protein
MWMADYGSDFLYAVVDSATAIPFNPSVSADYGMSRPAGLATLQLSDGYHFYMAQQAADEVVEFSPMGSMTRVVNGLIPGATGIAPFPPAACPSPHCNHLFVSAQNGATSIFELDPVSGVATAFTGLSFVGAGLAWDPAGATLYAVSRVNGENGSGTVLTFNASGAQVSNTIGLFGAGPDGIAVGTGNQAGCLYVNANDGNVFEIMLTGTTGCSGFVFNPTTQVLPVASGGSRGDLVAVDPAITVAGGSTMFSTLLVTQTDGIYRLNPAPFAGWFGAPTSTLPPYVTASTVPAIRPWVFGVLSLLLIGTGLVVLRKERHGAAVTGSSAVPRT